MNQIFEQKEAIGQIIEILEGIRVEYPMVNKELNAGIIGLQKVWNQLAMREAALISIANGSTRDAKSQTQ